jgi:hypothetical protein
MALFRRDSENRFKAKAVADLEVVSGKLDVARETQAADENALLAARLQAALSDDPDAVMEPLRERLARGTAAVEFYEGALADAQRAQAVRVAAAADTAEKARRKAIGTHVASLAKNGGKVRDGLAQMLDGWSEMQRLIGKYQSLLTPAEIRTQFGHTAPESVLAAVIAAEMYRQAPDVAGLPLQPLGGSHAIASFKRHGQSWSELPPIEEMVRGRFDVVPAIAPLPPAPALTDGSTVVAEPTPEPDGDDWHTAEMRKIQRLAAGGEETAAPAAEKTAKFLDENGFTNLQRALAAEAAAADAVEHEE